MRFGNKYGFNQLMAYDAARLPRQPVQGKLGNWVLILGAIALGLAIGFAI